MTCLEKDSLTLQYISYPNLEKQNHFTDEEECFYSVPEPQSGTVAERLFRFKRYQHAAIQYLAGGHHGASGIRSYRSGDSSPATGFCDAERGAQLSRYTFLRPYRSIASGKRTGYNSFYSYDSGLLSRYPITDSTTIFPIKNDHGTIYKLRTTLYGHSCAVYTAHLDYQNDTYYEVRGYDGNTWQKMAAPLTDTTEILKRNALSLRDEAIHNFMADAQKEIAGGSLVFLGGDFNEPSHLDWTEATKDSADHHGVVISWPATSTLQQHGFRDAYRTLYPNPVTHPGYTYPSDNPALAPEKITWTPNADERERIDFIFYYPHKNLKLKEAAVVGPNGCIRKGKRAPELSQDSFILPLDTWPSDHKGVWAKFRIKEKKSK